MNRWIRNLIYLTALGLAFPWLVVRRCTTGRYRSGLRQKLLGLSPTNWAEAADWAEPSAWDAGDGPNLKTVWLHGVSVGEVLLLSSLLERLQHELPQTRFVVSTTTDSGMQLARKLMPTVRLFYFPLDFSWAIHRALQALQPSMIVLGELELWPNLIDCAHRAGVPICVVNGRLSQRSERGYRRLSWITRSMFSKLSLVTAQSETYAERFRNCGTPAERIAVTGSVKFDNVTFEREAENVRRLGELVGVQPQQTIWIAGSTQPPEEMAACEVFLELREGFPDLRLIVVPRHPDRFDEVHDQLASTGVRLLRRSALTGPIQATEWDVLIVDTVGELKWWWGLADLALVGGSFGKRGGQNMLEPAAYGADVAFGPNTSNFRDSVELLLSHNAATRLTSLQSIQDWVHQGLVDRDAGKRRGENARRMIAAHQGALERTIQLLLKPTKGRQAEARRRVA